MSLQLFAHPFSSYSQKALIALYETGAPFAYRNLEEEVARVQLEAIWPMKKFPVLVDAGRILPEATIIVEYLDRHHPGAAPLVPREEEARLDARAMDRFFDNYVMTPMQKIVGDALRPADRRDSLGVEDARAMLDRAYGWLERHMADRVWAAGEAFSLADCAAAPALFYADWAHPIGVGRPALADYRARLLARPSFARAVEEARPYRRLFPLGAPDRD